MKPRALRTAERFTFAARAAAAKFESRRRGPAATGMALPVALRWRRAIASAPGTRAGYVVERPTAIFFSPRIHLHFSTRCIGPVAGRPAFRYALERASSKAARRQPQVKTWRPMERAVALPRLMLQPVATLVQVAVAEATSTQRSELAAGGRRPALPHPLERAERQASSSTAVTARPAAARARRIDPEGLASSVSRVVRRELDLRVSRSYEITRYAAPRRREASRPPVSLARSPELVWRSPARVAGDVPLENVRTGSLAPRTTARTITATEPGRDVTASTPRAHANPLTALDARFVDRLTDDVIRRVERRVRIERERRGL